MHYPINYIISDRKYDPFLSLRSAVATPELQFHKQECELFEGTSCCFYHNQIPAVHAHLYPSHTPVHIDFTPLESTCPRMSAPLNSLLIKQACRYDLLTKEQRAQLRHLSIYLAICSQCHRVPSSCCQIHLCCHPSSTFQGSTEWLWIQQCMKRD